MATTKKEKEHKEEEDKVKTLIEWHAPVRPFKKRQKSFFQSILLIAFLVEIILFFFTQYMLMLVVISFVFLVFVLNTIPPHDFFYRFSSEGVTVEDHFFLWQELYDFYFKRKHNMDVLHIGTKALIPGELTIPMPHNISEDKIKNVLIDYLPFRELVKTSTIDKASDWLTRTFPLEDLSKSRKDA